MPRSFKSNVCPRDRKEVLEPRRATLNTMMAYDNNNIKAKDTLRKYRTGFNCAWNITPCRNILKKAGFKPPGQYLRYNQQGGLLFALPREIPKRFGDEQAGLVMRAALRAHVTREQAHGIRKTLSYIHQLQTGEDKSNYPSVSKVLNKWPDEKFGEPTQTIEAIHIVEPDDLKTAMTKEWTPATEMKLLHWSVGYLVVYHWCLNGARSGCDLNLRIKPRKTVIVPSQGYMFTQYARGGRAKLQPEQPKRPWRAYAICMCVDGKHKGPPVNWFEYEVDERQPDWTTTCPLSCYQLIQLYNPGDCRIFPSLTKHGFRKEGSKGNMSQDTMFVFARKWLNVQDGNPDGLRYCNNQGRKCLGKLCDKLNIVYKESFECHGDDYKNWKYYQDHISEDKNFERRTQSMDLDVVLKCLRRIARFFGRGFQQRADPDVLSHDQVGRLLAYQLRLAGHGGAVNEILDS